MRVAVVGHVEWIEFARVPDLPAPGAIVHASESWEEPGGGGAVAAVQLAKLADGAVFLTALGDDDTGHAAADTLPALATSRRGGAGAATAGGELRQGGALRLEIAWRPVPQRRAVVHIDARGERTITVIGDRLGPSGGDGLPWRELAGCDAVYFTAGDADAARRARAARVLVGTARVLPTLAESGVVLDALVTSVQDAGEAYEPGDLDPDPRLVVRTAGAAGGTWETQAGERGEWAATPLPGPVEDAYGCGDSFAAGLTYALGAGMSPARATRFAARCGAACLTGRGPYSGQLATAP
jgi:ribokinase